MNAAVLVTHEIDSAYWHEWELFGIPGGLQLFLVLNLLLVLRIFYGHQALLTGRRAPSVFLLQGSHDAGVAGIASYNTGAVAGGVPVAAQAG